MRPSGASKAGARPAVVAATVVAVLLLAATGCAGEARGPSPGAVEVPGYPPEPRPEDFPGISYPPAPGPLPRPGSPGGPVWLIGIDGATWDLIEPLAARGELPNFRALMEQGVHGTLRSEPPTISPALWSTIATGVPRFVHGVVNFTVRKPDSYKTIEAGPPDRRSPALWELVGAAGGTSAVISWFGSYPAEPIPGFYLAKRFDPEQLRPGQVHPESFAGRLRDRARVSLRRTDLERIAVNDTFRETLLHDARTLAALRVVAGEGRPDLVAVHFAGIDVVQHLTWGHMAPEAHPFPGEETPHPVLAEVIPSYYRYIDHVLGEIRALAPAGTTLVVVSDHGAGPMERDEAFLLELPVLLDEIGIVDQGVAFAISELYRHEKRIWINLEGVEPQGFVPVAHAHRVALRLRDALARLRTEEGVPVFAAIDVHTDRPGWRPGDRALTVRFSHAARAAEEVLDGSRRIDMSRVRKRIPGNSGSHRPDGILLIAGPGVRSGRLSRPANLYHVAPTVLYLLGLPQDARMLRHAPADGGVLLDALDPALLAGHPVRMVPEYPGTDRRELLRARLGAEGSKVDPTHDEAVERLRSLGYVQ